MIKKRSEDTITNHRNEKDDINTDFTDIRRIIRDYYEQHYGNKFTKLDQTSSLKGKPPKFTPEETDNPNTSISLLK